MKKKTLPHHSQDTESSEERLLLKGKEIGRIHVDGNSQVTPEALIEWMNETAAKDSTVWSNLRIKAYTQPFEAYQSLERSYVVLVGDRLETHKEYKERQEHIISGWQHEYEEFLRKKSFYDHPVGIARIQEIEKKKKRPINHPRS